MFSLDHLCMMWVQRGTGRDEKRGPLLRAVRCGLLALETPGRHALQRRRP